MGMKLVKIYDKLLRENEVERCVSNFGDGIIGSKIKRPKFIENIKNLKTCLAKHPTAFSSDKMVFRGIQLSIRDLLYRFNELEDNNDGLFSFMYAPSVVQVWAHNEYDINIELNIDLKSFIKQYEDIDDKEVKKSFIYNNKGKIMKMMVPVVVRLDASPDDFLLKVDELPQYVRNVYKDEILRLNTQPTKVMGKIPDSVFEPILEILKCIRKFEVPSYQSKYQQNHQS